VAACFTHPLDVTKVFVLNNFSFFSQHNTFTERSFSHDSRMQTLAGLPSTSTSTAGALRPSTLTVIRTSVQKSGMRSLYVGLSASLLRQMSYSLVRLGAYDAMKSHLSKNKQATPGSLFLAACLAGGMGGIAGNPAGELLEYSGSKHSN
jgi:dicarboxylate transporter 10